MAASTNPARSPGGSMRKRRFVVLGTALLAALAAVLTAVAISPGSSHREAPLSALDPTGDDTDVYAFKAPDSPEVSENVLARNVPVAPDNVGPKTIPHYGAVADQAITNVDGGGNVFAGQRDDPFFVNLGATFDALTIRNGTGNAGGGKDDAAGYGVHSIVLQAP